MLYRPLQVYHIHQLHPGLVDGMVVVVGKEIGDTVRAGKAAFFVKRHGQRAVAGAHLQEGIVSRILAHKEVDQRFAVALSLRLRFHGEVLKLQISRRPRR